mmetsp:Transcript_2835/g.8236  ORF Transcript_2835/g.8236 Transcript_2835/m.8236 type:complete len:229 (-) Transcript_2835:299-985(-)
MRATQSWRRAAHPNAGTPLVAPNGLGSGRQGKVSSTMSVRHSPPAQSRTWYAPDASTTREGKTAASSRGRSASSASAESSQQSPSAPCRMSCGVAPPRTTSHASCARLLPTPIPRKRERREETSIPPAESCFSSGRSRREDGRSQTRSPSPARCRFADDPSCCHPLPSRKSDVAAGGKSGSVKGEPDSRQKERTRSSTSAARASCAACLSSTDTEVLLRERRAAGGVG